MELRVFLVLGLFLCVFQGVLATDSQESSAATALASVTWNSSHGFRVIEGTLSTSNDTVAWGNFTNATNQTGWSFLEINTNEKFPDKVQVKRLKKNTICYVAFKCASYNTISVFNVTFFIY